MGQKDIAEKRLEAYNDVFADIVNVLLFDGKPVVSEDDLEDESARSQYKADDRLHEQERDVAKFWKNGSIRICLYGLENQTVVDADIPLRVMGYDGAAYRAQLLADRAPDGKGAAFCASERRRKRFPVVTLVLYFGMERWNKSHSLYDCLDVPPELQPYVSDYKVNIFEIAWLEPETVRRFTSDFRIVADYFVQLRMNKDYQPSKDVIAHVHEILQLMSVLTGDDRFEQAQNMTDDAQEVTMCEVLDRVERRGFAKGETRGFARGESHGIAIGESRMMSLFSQLLGAGRIADAQRASTDREYLRQLFEEYQK